MKEIRDNCGVFGLYASGPCAYEIYQGIDLLQHRGQEYCGLATYDGQVHQVTHHGKVLNSFTDKDLEVLPGNWGIGHVSLNERQPVKWQSLLGEIAVAFSGNIINADEIIQEMMEQGTAFWRGFNVEVLSKIVLGKKVISSPGTLASLSMWIS